MTKFIICHSASLHIYACLELTRFNITVYKFHDVINQIIFKCLQKLNVTANLQNIFRLTTHDQSLFMLLMYDFKIYRYMYSLSVSYSFFKRQTINYILCIFSVHFFCAFFLRIFSVHIKVCKQEI